MFYGQQKKYISYLQTRSEGEVKVHSKVHSNVHIKIKGETKHFMDAYQSPVSVYIEDDVIITE